MMKRLLAGFLALCLALSGCAAPQEGPKLYEATFLTLFDTLTVIKGPADSQEHFSETAQAIHDTLLSYHRLFDIYNDYEGLNNLKTVNDNAGIAPVQVDRAVIDLLLDCKEYYALTGGMVNVALGSVLKLWHEARNDGLDDPANASLPDGDSLAAAARHVSLDAVVIDEDASTVYISDPLIRLDVGAVAKGWAAQRAAEAAPAGLLISVGGNVCATGPKDENGTPWVIGVQDPDNAGQYLHTIAITTGSAVTSGDYQRYYLVDGKMYHHIIDPETLHPGTRWRSVTILCQDSGLADALSTALFLLPLEEGMALADACDAQAMWIDREGKVTYTPGFEDYIRT